MLDQPRQPRPQGSTYLSMVYQRSNQEEDKQTLLKHVVTIYANQGFRWNKQPTNIPELSMILKIPQTEIMDMVSQVGRNMGSLASRDNIENTLQSIVSLSTSFALQDRGMIQQQLELLITSQDGKYKPFISGEVNKALKTLLDSNKNITDLYKTFFTSSGNTTNILIQGTQGEDTGDHNPDLLSPDDALQIILNRALPGHEEDIDNKVAKLAIRKLGQGSEYDTEADECYEKYGIGDKTTVKEGRTGSDALLALEPSIPSSEEPEGHKASKPLHSDDGGFKRREYDVEDVDALPE